jgi:hypothetical protein
MEQTFECVEKHLYRRQFKPLAATGARCITSSSRIGKRSGDPSRQGPDLKTARDECKVLEARNIRKEDFDIKVEAEPPERLTIAKYLPVFLQTKKGTKSYGFWKSCASHVDRLLGSFPLDEITRSKRRAIKQLRPSRSIDVESRLRTLMSEPRRLAESLRHGQHVEPCCREWSPQEDSSDKEFERLRRSFGARESSGS